MKNRISPELIDKYLQGQCSQEEVDMINKWYDSYDAAADPLSTLSEDEQLTIRQLMHNRIKARIRAVETPRRNVKLFIYAGIAAAILLLLGIRLMMKPREQPVQQIVFTNTSKGMMKQLLPDSSMVWLQPNATISYSNRAVYLTGDAFFEITKDPAHPFIVYSGTMITRVLGTSFYVNSGKQEVTVLSGKVAVRMETAAEVILLPQQKVTVAAGTQQLVKEKATPDLWQQQNISFDNVPVKEVIDTLNKVFNTHILLEDEALGKYLFKADFTGQNLPAILEIMEQSLEVTYEIRNNEIILKH
jgi:ferric-dicitrate binding protein FerR (iron transport regulator)